MKKIISTMLLGSLLSAQLKTENVINITNASKVEVYSALFWAPCKEAKLLLQSRGIEFDTKTITFSRKKFEEMIKRTGGKKSVPQIMVDDKYIGGLTELKLYYKDK